MKEKWKKYLNQINELYNFQFKEKPLVTRLIFFLLAYGDIFSIKTPIHGLDYIYRFRGNKTVLEEDLKKTNKLDFFILLIFLIWVGIVYIPSNLYINALQWVVWVFGFYRLWDILSQRLRSIFIDPYFLRINQHKKTNQENSGNLIDPLRSLLFAFLNYLEIILIFSAFYKNIPCELFNMNLTGFNSFYFSLVTITTLGYGDIYPTAQSIGPKILITMEVLIGLIFIILIIGAIVSKITELYGSKKY